MRSRAHVLGEHRAVRCSMSGRNQTGGAGSMSAAGRCRSPSPSSGFGDPRPASCSLRCSSRSTGQLRRTGGRGWAGLGNDRWWQACSARARCPDHAARSKRRQRGLPADTRDVPRRPAGARIFSVQLRKFGSPRDRSPALRSQACRRLRSSWSPEPRPSITQRSAACSRALSQPMRAPLIGAAGRPRRRPSTWASSHSPHSR